MNGPFYTVGHSNRTIGAFIGLLKEAGVEQVADIRTIPKSRANPQFNTDALAPAHEAEGVGYDLIADLGGLRGKARTVPAALNGFWTNTSFHNYADYALSERFHTGLARLIAEGRARPTAMMCAEAVWWRCHRRIVSDYLIARGETVLHIMATGRIEPARLTEGAIVRPDGTVVYPAAEPPPA